MRRVYIAIGVLFITVVGLIVLSLTSNHSTLQQIPTIPTPTPVPVAVPYKQGSIPVTTVNPQPGSTVPSAQQITITIDPSVSVQNVVFHIAPNVPYTTTTQGNSLIITPDQPLTPGTTYSYSLSPSNGQGTPTTASFTIEGPTPTFAGPDTAVGAKKERDAYLLQSNPSAYLADQLPYPGNDLSITATLKSAGGYHFNISILNPDKEAGRTSFINWAHSLGLTDSQINNLDITYQ